MVITTLAIDSQRHVQRRRQGVIFLAGLLAVLILALPRLSAAELLDYYEVANAQHPESVAWDPIERKFYAGSILAKGIVRIDGDSGEWDVFIPVYELPFSSVTGLRVDPVRRTL